MKTFGDHLSADQRLALARSEFFDKLPVIRDVARGVSVPPQNSSVREPLLQGFGDALGADAVVAEPVSEALGRIAPGFDVVSRSSGK